MKNKATNNMNFPIASMPEKSLWQAALIEPMMNNITNATKCIIINLTFLKCIFNFSVVPEKTFSTTIYLYQQICIYVCVLLITPCKRLPPNNQLHFSDLISLLSSNHFTDPSRLIGISTLAPELYSSTVDNLPASALSIFLTSSIGSHLTFFFKSK